jgi:tetratricopeptide (TPR) repeat protein
MPAQQQALSLSANNMKRLFFATVTIFFLSCNSGYEVDKHLSKDSLFHLAEISDSTKKLDKSISYYTRILEIDSTNLTALVNRGRALLAQKKIKSGLADYDKAVKLYPDPLVYATRGMAFLTIDDSKNAFANFAVAAMLDSNCSKAYYGYSLIKLNHKQYNYALSWCNKADSLGYDNELSTLIHSRLKLERDGK